MKKNHLQMKYSLVVGISCALMCFFFSSPAWYFLNSNFQIFEKIAVDTHPRLISGLEREQLWISLLFIGGPLLAGLLTAWTTRRMTSQWLEPLNQMEKHMRKLTRGDYSQAHFHRRESDEMREITATYDFLSRSLRAQSEQELKALESLIISSQEIESTRLLQHLISIKRSQLGLVNPNPEISVEFGAIPLKHRAS